MKRKEGENWKWGGVWGKLESVEYVRVHLVICTV